MLSDIAFCTVCRMLQYHDLSVAVCCSVLHCVAVCCSVLQCVAVCCSALQYRHVFSVMQVESAANFLDAMRACERDSGCASARTHAWSIEKYMCTGVEIMLIVRQ